MDARGEAELLELARTAAEAGARELVARFGAVATGVRTKSSPTDPVSDADLAAEAAIRETIAARRPNDAILGEEEGESGTGQTRWVVDPLDGTVNFLFGLPVFAVSVACEDEEGALAGVVLDPIRAECFTATRTGEAQLGGAPIRGGGRGELSEALVATGFGYQPAVRTRQAAVLAAVLPRVRDVRRAGAAALDLAWAACGRVDAYYERGVKRWDFAAGALIAERAGLVVRRLPASDEDPAGLVVAPAGMIEELFSLVSA